MTSAERRVAATDRSIEAETSSDDVQLALIVGSIHLVLVVVEEVVAPVPLLRVPLGLGLVLFVPGYFVTAAALPRRSDLSKVERLGFSVALSIASIALLVLLLDALPWGLDPSALIFGTYVWTGVFGVLALARRMRLGGEAAIGDLGWRPNPWWDSLESRDRKGFGVVIAAGCVMVAVGLAALVAPVRDRSITELYVLGSSDRIGGYPYQAGADGLVELTVGVANHERFAREYQIEALAYEGDGNRSVRVYRSPAFELLPGAVREVAAWWRMPAAGDARRVDVRLLAEDEPTPYRALTLWVDVPLSGESDVASSSGN